MIEHAFTARMRAVLVFMAAILPNDYYELLPA